MYRPFLKRMFHLVMDYFSHNPVNKNTVLVSQSQLSKESLMSFLILNPKASHKKSTID